MYLHSAPVQRRSRISRRAVLAGAGGAGIVAAACSQATAPEKVSTFKGPVEVTYMDWFKDRITYWEDQFRVINQAQPQVKFQLSIVPMSEYLDKIKVGLAGDSAPDAFFLHHSQFLDLATIGGLQPLTPARVPFKPFEQEWTGFKEQHFHWENKPYWAALGLMVPALFINLDLWESAGMGERDIPATWDQLHQVAKKLSRRGADGRLSPAGLVADPGGAAFWMDVMRYQKGLWHFSKDGKRSLQNHPENVRSLEYILRMWNDNIWPEKRELAAFTRREAVIAYSFTWYVNNVRLNAPDLRFRLVPMPTITGQDLPARHVRVYDPASPVISSTTKGDRLDAAWMLVKQIIADEDANAELVRQHTTAPNWARLQNHRALKDDQGVQAVTKITPYTVLPGWLNLKVEGMNASITDVFNKDASPKETLDRVTEQETIALGRNVNVVRERQYAHAAQFKE